MQENTGGAGLYTAEIQSAVDRVAMGGPIRFDLGCGHKKEDGWVRVDFDTDRKKVTTKGEVIDNASALSPDIPCDLRAVPVPDNYVDEARAIHVIEHFYAWDAPKALAEWVRILKPGGTLAIECPSLEKICKLMDVPNCPPHLTFWGLYGDPRLEDEVMTHRWCYTERQLGSLMQKAGLVDIFGQMPRYHQQVRDMRLVGTKPEPPRLVLPS